MRSADDPAVLLAPRSTYLYLAIQPCIVALVVFLASGSISVEAFGQLLQTESQTNTVHGTVINAVTHDPIARALVSSTDNRYATLTDGEGHFEFTLPKDAAYAGGPSLVARKPGFMDDPNERRQGEASPDAEVTISLVPEGLIKGRVTFSAADPANRVLRPGLQFPLR